MFVNFNNTGSNQFLATTQAVGEEGGEISTRARFEEGGEDFFLVMQLSETSSRILTMSLCGEFTASQFH